jgi:hypothetical protein
MTRSIEVRKSHRIELRSMVVTRTNSSQECLTRAKRAKRVKSHILGRRLPNDSTDPVDFTNLP